MKIAYIRFNNEIELDYKTASISIKGTERRLGIFDALVSQGHTINIYSKVKKLDRSSILNKNNLFSSNTMFDNIYLKYGEYPKDEDVLLIENGTTNTLFSSSDGIPFIEKSFKIIERWKGPVTYLQWDAELPFPFGESTRDPSKDVSDNNLTKLVNSYNLFKDKSWKIITTAMDKQKFLEHYIAARYRYCDFFTDVESIPLCYSEKIDLKFYPSVNQKEDIIYIGTESDPYRNNLLSEYLNNTGTKIIGSWSNTKKFTGVIFLGVLKGHGNVSTMYNTSKTTVQCGEKGWCDMGHMTSRFFQALGGGCIPILIDKYSSSFTDRYLPSRYYLSLSRDDYDKKIDEIREWSVEKRREEVEKILKHNKKWSDLKWKEIL